MRGRVYVGDLIQEFEKRIDQHRIRRRGLDKAAFRDLARAVVKRASESYLLEHSDGAWLTHVEELLATLNTRKGDEILVDIRSSEGEESTRVVTCLPDQPFIVDTIRLCFDQRGHGVRHQINMILPVERSSAGKLRALGVESSEHPPESIALFEIDRLAAATEREELAATLLERLERARATVADFESMRELLRQRVSSYAHMGRIGDTKLRPIFHECQAFLEWLAADHFVFLGMEEWNDTKSVARYGLSRFERDRSKNERDNMREFVKAGAKGERILLRKSIRESTIHRGGKIDQILLRDFDEAGNAVGGLYIKGQFTYRAIQTRGGQVPLLRKKLDELLRVEDLRPGTYNYKSISNGFNSLPVEYLFGAPIPDIRRLVRRSLMAERERRLEVHLSMGDQRRSAYLFVVMPREIFREDLRASIQDFVGEVLGANYSDGRVLIGTHGVAVLHYYFTAANQFKEADLEELERRVASRSASWHDQFRQVVLQSLPQEEALQLYRLYHDAFSRRYQVSTAPEQVLIDCQELERVHAEGGLGFVLYADEEDAAQDTIKLRIYEAQNLHLSDVLPVLDNFGLKVINAFTNHVERSGGAVLYMDTFRFQRSNCEWLDDEVGKKSFLAAVRAVFEGRATNDPLNRVLFPVRLRWQQIEVLRSVQAYARQLGNMITPGSVWRTLASYAPTVKLIVELYEAKFGPTARGKLESAPSRARRQRCAKLRQEILDQIDAVSSFSDDRLLRVFFNLVDAMLRTSFFNEAREHASIAHKFDCTAIQFMPDPKPWREIYVHHMDLEGVHLRGGRIARGGLRWSDRPEDYRTEILGLMLTQMVKNVVIVPVGAKGGFVLRRPPADPAERRTYADERYEIFIHALLDLADNMGAKGTVAPKGVVCWDEPDPYFVVAADKGTAHLSDTANAVSQARGFWLGDAFASGGSNGYDHKGLGITAKGAWVSLRHVLRELGVRASQQEFTVAGIGDMGGDVFGNGMLEHRTIKLVAAFNHRHIFIDPNPDAKASYRERRRLFRAKHGGWDAYDTKLLSRGGGIFERGAKKITLSAAARQLLGAEASTVSGNELIRLILKAEVDVLYNGGIGTYVKATGESDADAADPANDAVRVNASDVRARSVGEGGNLGFTQAARIEYAKAGGKINTDFIDNAGGVNCSDHEVNLKILLQPLLRSGKLKDAARNRMLKEVEGNVVDDVLAANGDQALLLSLDEHRSGQNLAPFDGVMDDVCRRFSVKRTTLDLPTVREIQRRMEEGEGLTRPELATLSSYVKMGLYDDLVEDPQIELEGILPALRNYFPERVRRRFGKAIENHHLGREIALTRLTNRIIDHTGVSFFREMAVDCDANARQTFEAYSMLSRAAKTWDLKVEIAELGGRVDVEWRYRALLMVESALRMGTQYLLEHWTEKQIRDTLRNTQQYAAKLRALEGTYAQLLDESGRERVAQTESELRKGGLPSAVAKRLSAMRPLHHGLAVQDLADRMRKPVKRVGADYFAFGRDTGIFAVLRQLEDLRSREYYDALALRAQRRELEGLLRDVVVKLAGVSGSPKERLQSLGPGASVFDELAEIPPDDFGPAALLVCMDRIRNVLRKKKV